MGHTRCEVIMPPVKDVDGVVAAVLSPYDVDSEESTSYGFYDYYKIGGRYSGHKFQHLQDKVKMSAFWEWLERNVTISCFQFGKYELQPANQREKVDAKWNEMFPSESGDFLPCPLFDHSGDKFVNDIDTLRHEYDTLTCGRVLFCAPSYVTTTELWTGELEVKWMLATTAWNGKNHMPIMWDGTIGDALRQYKEQLARCAEAYKEACTPTSEWLIVTVDCHS